MLAMCPCTGCNTVHLLFIRQVHRNPFEALIHGPWLLGDIFWINDLNRAFFLLLGLVYSRSVGIAVMLYCRLTKPGNWLGLPEFI